MIKVTVELCPFGSEKNKETLAEMKIWNDATGTKSIGNYCYKIFKKHSKTQIWRLGEVKNFKRLQLGVWDLLYLVLKDAVGDRNDCR